MFSIASSSDFLAVLVDALIFGRLIHGFSPKTDPLLLASATIYVPSRRAARALSATFLASGMADAAILPAIRLLGDVDDEAFGLDTTLEDLPGNSQIIQPLERQLVLAGLIDQWVSHMSDATRALYDDEDIVIPASSADAIKLADDLCRLLNQITMEEISWSAIGAIIPDDKDWAEWWRLTATFLKIIMENWPEHLKTLGLIDPAQRQADLLDRRSSHYEIHGSHDPVIIAGSTGSVPATRRLLKAVAGMKNGAIVLPGLDFNMADGEWQHLTRGDTLTDPTLETHPQFGLARLVARIGVARDQVRELSIGGTKHGERGRLMSLAMAPAEFTGDWFEMTGKFDAKRASEALSGISIIQAPGEREEALAIAIAMREVLEKGEQTAALVTPDRNLARRVCAELQRFAIEVDDSGGLSLKRTPAAMFLRSLIDVVFGSGDPVAVTALIKNPLCRIGYKRDAANRIARHLELTAMRGVIHPPSLVGFAQFLQAKRQSLAFETHVPTAVRKIDDKDWDRLIGYAVKLDTIVLPLTITASADKPQSLQHLFGELANTAEQLCLNEDGMTLLLEGLGGAELARLFEDIALSSSAGKYRIKPAEFLNVFDALLGDQLVRPRNITNPRLHILGPLEARLLNYDRIILGGLNEGTWPQTTGNDVFLNRAMRLELAMASPERRIGLAAHDFQQLSGSREVVFSRSQRAERSPTTASRWLLRLTALVGNSRADEMTGRGNRFLQLASAIDGSGKHSARAERPRPVPPLAVRPNNLSVSDIGLWVRDPYALYAKRILKLQPLDPLQRKADAALKGTLYHAILAQFVGSDMAGMDAKAKLSHLITIARRVIETENLTPEITEIWFLRFCEIAADFIKWEEQRAGELQIMRTACEIEGKLALADDSFVLRARADRIDILKDGSLIVLDYKTGTSPGIKQARTFTPPLAPQMALEGAIARAGGFAGIAASDISNLAFYRLRRDKGGEQKLATRELDTSELVDDALSSLEELIRAYQHPDKAYVSRLHPFKQGEFGGDYDHLARAREWSLADEDAGEGGDDE